MCVVTPAEVSGIAQAFPSFANVTPGLSSQEEKGTLPPNAGAVLGKDGNASYVDTVSISELSRQAITANVKKEDAAVAAEKKAAEANVLNNDAKPDRAAAKVQFVYDLKGELSIRYMDTANRLIYQVPSELMLHLKEAVSKSDSSVDTKA